MDAFIPYVLIERDDLSSGWQALGTFQSADDAVYVIDKTPGTYFFLVQRTDFTGPFPPTQFPPMFAVQLYDIWAEMGGSWNGPWSSQNAISGGHLIGSMNAGTSTRRWFLFRH